MNREIKFRAWDTDKEEYIYPHERQSLTSCCTVIELLENYPIYGGKYTTSIVYSCNGYLEQFTGFIDKNKTPIFENDLILLNGIEYKIVFDHGCFILHNDKIAELILLGIEMSKNKNIKVIGNIREAIK